MREFARSPSRLAPGGQPRPGPGGDAARAGAGLRGAAARPRLLPGRRRGVRGDERELRAGDDPAPARLRRRRRDGLRLPGQERPAPGAVDPRRRRDRRGRGDAPPPQRPRRPARLPRGRRLARRPLDRRQRLHPGEDRRRASRPRTSAPGAAPSSPPPPSPASRSRSPKPPPSARSPPPSRASPRRSATPPRSAAAPTSTRASSTATATASRSRSASPATARSRRAAGHGSSAPSSIWSPEPFCPSGRRVAKARTRARGCDQKGASMFDQLKGKRIAFLVANEGVEQVELTEPLKAVRERRGRGRPARARSRRGPGLQPPRQGRPFEVDRAVGDADAGEYDGLVLPGGVANPDQLRTRRGGGRVRPRLLRGRQAGRGDLPRRPGP